MITYKIPKVIHYCWFGKGEKSSLSKKCIDGWKKKLPEYEIIEWNENNFDIKCNKYVHEAYKGKKYAFVSDYVRLFALYNYGGIYLDTDVEVLKSFDEFLNLDGFVGFEDTELVSTAIIGSKKNNKIIKIWLDTYKERAFIQDGKINDTTNVRVLTNILLELGMKQNNKLQDLYEGELSIFPIEYFSPLRIGSKKPKLTENTITIHWFEGSWVNFGKKIKIKIITTIKSLIGFKNYNRLRDYIIGGYK